MTYLDVSHHSLQLYILTIHGAHKLVLLHPTLGPSLAMLIMRVVLCRISTLHLHRLCHHQSHQFQIHFPSLSACMTLVRLLSSFLNVFFYSSSDSFATFSDVKPFTRAAETPSGVLMDKTGCRLIKYQIHFLLADYLSWLKDCFSRSQWPCGLRRGLRPLAY